MNFLCFINAWVLIIIVSSFGCLYWQLIKWCGIVFFSAVFPPFFPDEQTSYLCIWLGANEFGQLGDGTEESKKHPQKVMQLQTEFVKSVSCGAHCTAAIAEPRDNDGTISTSRLWVWGQNQVVHFVSIKLLLSFFNLWTLVGRLQLQWLRKSRLDAKNLYLLSVFLLLFLR